MPVHDGLGSNQDERLPPPGPEHFQGNPEQLVQGSQSTARSLRVQSQQLLMESQVLKDEILMGAESAKQPAEQMSKRHDHVKNVTETSRIQLCAKSFILQVYDVLARHRPRRRLRSSSRPVALRCQDSARQRSASCRSPRKLPVGVLDPDDGNPFPARFSDKAADI